MVNILKGVKFATTGPDMLSTYVDSISTDVDTKTNITLGRFSTEENTKGFGLIKTSTKTSEKVEKPKK